MSEEKKIRLYPDTSVPSAFYDTSKPVRQLIMQKWFENDALSYELYISVTAVGNRSDLTDRIHLMSFLIKTV